MIFKGKCIGVLFADDIVLISESKEDINVKMELWRETLEFKGYRISRTKTKFMECKFNQSRSRGNHGFKYRYRSVFWSGRKPVYTIIHRPVYHFLYFIFIFWSGTMVFGVFLDLFLNIVPVIIIYVFDL